MLIRVKRHLVFLSLFVLAGFFFLYRQTPYLPFRDQEGSSSNDVNATDDEPCQCSTCELQPHELEVMDWDSSKVLRGSPTERFRGMVISHHLMIRVQIVLLDNLRNDTRYLTSCAAAGFSMNLPIFHQT